FFFSSRRRHTRFSRDWSSDVCSSDLRVVACVNACDGIPTEALEADVVRELIEAATRYLAVTMRESDDDPNCWAEEEFAKDKLRRSEERRVGKECVGRWYP